MDDTHTVQCEACRGAGERTVKITTDTMYWCTVDKHEVCVGRLEDWQGGFLLHVRQCDCDCGHAE